MGSLTGDLESGGRRARARRLIRWIWIALAVLCGVALILYIFNVPIRVLLSEKAHRALSIDLTVVLGTAETVDERTVTVDGRLGRVSESGFLVFFNDLGTGEFRLTYQYKGLPHVADIVIHEPGGYVTINFGQAYSDIDGRAEVLDLRGAFPNSLNRIKETTLERFSGDLTDGGAREGSE